MGGIISGQWESISIAPAVSFFFVRSAQQRGPTLLIDHCVSWPQSSAAHSRGNVFQVYPALLKPGEANISSYKHVSVCFRRALALRGVSFNTSVCSRRGRFQGTSFHGLTPCATSIM